MKHRHKPKLLPYTISKTKDGLFFYCHRRGYEFSPVFGSVGDRAKAQKYCDMMNKSKGAKE